MHFLELQFLIGSVSLQEADTDLEMRTGVVTLQQLLNFRDDARFKDEAQVTIEEIQMPGTGSEATDLTEVV